ncbi:hypothetical protein B0H14DRAFT_3646422, partial [Mycena olivaceomarginata]
RLRQRSLSASPTKAASSEVKGGKLTRDQLLKMGQDELRRRCLLGRLDGVAESVWMLFSSPAPGSTASPSAHKRRALPMSKVAAAIVKSSPYIFGRSCRFSGDAREAMSLLPEAAHHRWREMAGDARSVRWKYRRQPVQEAARPREPWSCN